MPIDYDKPLEPPEKLKVKAVAKSRKRSPRPKVITLDEAIETLQALGFSITVPTSAEEKERQEESLAKLGFKDSVKVPKGTKRPAKEPELLTGHLYLAHSIAEATYGPGELVLPVEQSSLFRSLLQQDQAAVRSFMDTSDRVPFSRCYLITPGRGHDNKNKFSKLEVSQDVFDSDHFIENVTVRAGATDIAGYNPVRVPSTF